MWDGETAGQGVELQGRHHTIWQRYFAIGAVRFDIFAQCLVDCFHLGGIEFDIHRVHGEIDRIDPDFGRWFGRIVVAGGEQEGGEYRQGNR